MREKPVIPHTQANRDIDQILASLLEASETVALGFVEALEKTCAHIARYRATETAHYAHELNIPGLLCQPLKHYPHLVFYIEHATHIAVWRVLDVERDIPAWLQESHNP